MRRRNTSVSEKCSHVRQVGKLFTVIVLSFGFVVVIVVCLLLFWVFLRLWENARQLCHTSWSLDIPLPLETAHCLFLAAKNHLWKSPTLHSWSKTQDMIMENLSPSKWLLIITRASGLGNFLKKWNRFKSVRKNLVTKSHWLYTSEKTQNIGRWSATSDLLLIHIKTS